MLYLCLRPLFLFGVSTVVDHDGSLEAAGASRPCRLGNTIQQWEQHLHARGRVSISVLNIVRP